jgi:hypothetical protein
MVQGAENSSTPNHCWETIKMMNPTAAEMGIGTTTKDGRPCVAIGKGDTPRNCQSDDFRNNYDDIDWGRNKTDKSKGDRDE